LKLSSNNKSKYSIDVSDRKSLNDNILKEKSLNIIESNNNYYKNDNDKNEIKDKLKNLKERYINFNTNRVSTRSTSRNTKNNNDLINKIESKLDKNLMK